MNIEEFKVYVQRDGERTGEMERNDSSVYCWIDPASGRGYTEDGSYFTGSITPYDLVAEYHEPVIPTVDWDKPLELMDGTECEGFSRDGDAHTTWTLKIAGRITTDAQGCIGGVQVIRNRAEPKRYKGEFFVSIYSNGSGGTAHRKRDSADKMDGPGRVACVRFEYDVEEGEGL